MKKKFVFALLVCCTLIAGCSKQPEEVLAPSVEPAVSHELNEYQTIVDTDLEKNPRAYGFSKNLSEEPDSFFFDTCQYTKDDFATSADLWETLARMNAMSPLADVGQFLVQTMQNTASDFRQEAITNLGTVGSSYDFKFVLNSISDTSEYEDTGIICIRVYANDEAGKVSDAEALFYGTGLDAMDVPILVFDKLKINVVKTTDVLPNRMMLGHYKEDIAPKETSEEEETESDGQEEINIRTTGLFEKEITEETEGLDSMIDPMPEMIDAETCTGVQIVEAAGQFVVADDITKPEHAVAAALRIAHVMRGEWYAYDDSIVTTLTYSSDAEELINKLGVTGHLIINFYEYEGGNCRLSWKITDSSMEITVFPTGNNTIPRTRVYYNGEFTTQWIPCNYKHVMHVDFAQ